MKAAGSSAQLEWLRRIELGYLLNPCQASHNVRKAASEPQAAAWGQAPKRAVLESQTYPVRFRLVRVTGNREKSCDRKLTLCHAFCHWTARRLQFKPLKKKTLDDDIKEETQNLGKFVDISAKVCHSLPFCKEGLGHNR